MKTWTLNSLRTIIYYETWHTIKNKKKKKTFFLLTLINKTNFNRLYGCDCLTCDVINSQGYFNFLRNDIYEVNETYNLYLHCPFSLWTIFSQHLPTFTLEIHIGDFRYQKCSSSNFKNAEDDSVSLSYHNYFIFKFHFTYEFNQIIYTIFISNVKWNDKPQNKITLVAKLFDFTVDYLISSYLFWWELDDHERSLSSP